MTSWPRRLRFGLAVFAALLAVTIAVSLRRAPSRAPAPVLVPHRDPNIVAESRSGRSVRLLGGKPDITVEHYDTMVQYADGRMLLTGVTVRMLQRRGRDFTVTAATAEVKGQSPNEDVGFEGAVHVSSSDGVSVRTEQASYDHARGIVSAPGEVRFARPGLRGQSVGLRYEHDRGLVTLIDRAIVHRDADGTDSAVEVQAGSASMARAGRTLRFWRGVRLSRGAETMTAGEVTVRLDPDGRRVQRAELRGGSTVAEPPGPGGGLTSMRGRDIDLDYGQDGRSLQRAVLNGDAAIEIAGGAGGGQHLSGQHVEAGLAPDGTTLTALLASGGVSLDLLAGASNPARSVRSGVLQASGAAGQGLTSAIFGEGVEFGEAAARATRTARSSTLTLALGHGLGRVESARFAGDVAFVQGALTARSREARYEIAKASLHLSGRDTKGRAPRVLDERVSIEADAIEVLLDQTRITASEAVKTELRADARGGGAGARVPALLRADQPVRAAAGHLVYDSGTSVAAYSGGVDLWQDQFALAAEQVELDQRKGSLTADGRVVSRMRFERSGAATAAGDPPGSMTATSGLLRYDDDARRITYSGKARLNSRERDLSADTVELYLRSASREIDRIEAEGAVSLLTGEGRKASGRRLVYEAEKAQYDMTGAPATLDDDAGQTTGRSLIFFRSVDRIVVDGKEQTRTELRRGIKR